MKKWIVFGMIIISGGMIFPSISFAESHCSENLVSITKYNGEQNCVKPTSFYKLLDRGWATHNDNNTGDMSLEVSEKFILSKLNPNGSLTVDSFKIEITQVAESYPEQYHILANIAISDPPIDWIIPDEHSIKLVVSNGIITKAIKDNFYDELKDKPISPFIDRYGEFSPDEILVTFIENTDEKLIKIILTDCYTESKESISNVNYLLKINTPSKTVYDTINCLEQGVYKNTKWVDVAEKNYIMKHE